MKGLVGGLCREEKISLWGRKFLFVLGATPNFVLSPKPLY